MKAFILTVLLTIIIIGNIEAVDIGSYQIIEHLRTISEPRRPEIIEDAVLFTASASFRRVGIAFAHDNYSKVHWLMHHVVPRDLADYEGLRRRERRALDPNIETGVLFHIEPIPANLRNMDYRMVIDGLWTADPLNPVSITGPSGIVESRVNLPFIPQAFAASNEPGTFTFQFNAPPGETITVGGSFNNWDPFMYALRETSPGFYTLVLSLPLGNFQYLFYHRGEQILDPLNTRRLFTMNGREVSEGTVR